ncbi:MAG: tetratricopeptide repeat protein, partial [bacterium]|nr:tetratricopeptide repeat protein [bacterium]
MGKEKTENKLSHLDKTRINAYSFIEVAEFAKAEKAALAAMKESDKEQAATEALLAMAQRGLGKLASAEEHAENAMKLAPEKADIVFVNALCKWSSGDYAKAKELFEKSLELAPDRWDMRLDYAGFLLHQQKFDECLIQTENVEKVNPEHPKAKMLRTCAFHENWQPSIDTLAFRPPVPLPEGKIETYLSIGRAHLRNDYYDLAMEEFSRALDINNNSNEAKSLYAAAFHFKNNGFSGWCKNFRRQLRSPLYLFITLIPMLAAAALGSYMQIYSSMTNAVICYAIACTYLMILIALYLRGYVTKTPQDFAFIIAQNGLTPQGRI